ncbi:MAG: MerR family transcriptional regulator [Thermoanaerobaculales bacterium]|nr:MerR family transcriptional regulator [Thermoanaerobaculales bacterium]
MIEERSYTIDEIEKRTGFDRRTIAYYVQQGLLPKVGRRGPRTRYSQLFFDRLQFIKMTRDLQDQGAMGTMTLSDFRDLFQSVPEKTIADIVSGRESPHVLARSAPPDELAMASSSDRKRAMVQRIEELQRDIANEPLPAPVESHGVPMDPAQRPTPIAEHEETFAERAYMRLPDAPQTAEERETPSGEYHRLTLEAIERSPDAQIPVRKSAPPPPVEDQLREALARLTAVVKRQPRAYLRTTETWTRARVTEELVLSARGLEERHLQLLERVARILRDLMRDRDGGF